MNRSFQENKSGKIIDMKKMVGTVDSSLFNILAVNLCILLIYGTHQHLYKDIQL